MWGIGSREARRTQQGDSALVRGEASALRVLGDRAAVEEVKQIVGAASLGAAAAHLKATKGLPPHHRACDGAVDIEMGIQIGDLKDVKNQIQKIKNEISDSLISDPLNSDSDSTASLNNEEL